MSDKSNTSFIQYALCNVCRIHHNIGVKHIYSKQHQKNTNEILKKTLNKISLANNCTKDVEVHDAHWATDDKFWCYFCGEELPKHQHSSSNLTIKGLGIVNHFSSHSHYEAGKKFLKDNRLSKGVEKYIMKKSDLLRFLEDIPNYEKKYVAKMEIIHRKHVSHIQETDIQRSSMVQATCSELAHNPGCSSNVINALSNLPSLNYAARHGDSRQKRSSEELVPPWLLPADATTCAVAKPSEEKVKNSVTIGPTISDLEEHIVKQQKKGLNPKRVGANFNHNAVNSDKWLPSFGRVWCQGRRKQSQLQFWHAKKKKKM